MIKRNGRGRRYGSARGEILGPQPDPRERKHPPRMFPLIKNESRGIERDAPVVATVNDANREFGGVTSMTRRAPDPGNRESLGSGGSMVAKLKLKGIDGRAPPGVEPAA